MTSYLKKQYDEYRDRNRSVPTFQSFVNHPSKDISKPMEKALCKNDLTQELLFRLSNSVLHIYSQSFLMKCWNILH